MSTKYWSIPPVEKVYEALTCIADDRILLDESGMQARVYSSSRNKFYTVSFNPESDSIMSDDNSAYYMHQISYPMIAFFMCRGDISFNTKLLPILADIPWKDINQKHSNDYTAAVKEVMKRKSEEGFDVSFVKSEVTNIY